ncbi:carbon monoxide dehydrogenase [Variovorax sp. WS11]|uniref:xanthine dehydrogenase family protein molybdopterin-binding subunit n=1 Tax=Variovorax sp. WS11 TaxID=1105204 RepID=UPI000D0CB707|nr:xanthine dehydrogenase family protein molybdopterin-binding subunit [Variovorax sp. WS11]NDZ17462.1 xanthine dehydrogenase family protein molybdopterin-binding subunit [Variovorax sp. WS11]PSL86003.1 carbon monoxide dehydrogenase [Variovorax sp. WS11]
MNISQSSTQLNGEIANFGIGQPIARVEDDPLLRGAGRYTDDIHLPGEGFLHVVRSPHAAAKIIRIDAAAAREAPGVVAVYTAADFAGLTIASIDSKVPHKRPDGTPHSRTPYQVLAAEHVPYLGDAVVAVVAESLNQAKDAAELIAIDYDALSSVTDAAVALATDAPRVWPHLADNTCMQYTLGSENAWAGAASMAARVVRERFVISRVATSSIEPRAAIGYFDNRAKRYVLYAGLQMPHEVGRDIAAAFGISSGDVHVISPDVGGGFGMKLALYQEYMLVLLASRKLGRPVRWISDRSEAFQSDQHARDTVSDVELALDAAGRFLGLRVRTVANLGAYIGQWSLHVPTGNLGGLTGPYKIAAFDVKVTGVLTNTVPVGPFRGAGRPEASYLIERIVDRAALELGVDPAELRMRNMIDANEMPYNTGLVFTYDCGEFKALMAETLEKSGWQDFASRREESSACGKLRGIGVAYVIESAGGPAGKAFDEHVEIRFDSGGTATIFVGTHSHGQGHETAYRQFAAEYLGMPFDAVRVVCGDTQLVSHGRGSFGSRTMMAGGSAFKSAAGRIIEKSKTIAAHVMEAAVEDIVYEKGRFAVRGTDKAMSLADVARTAFNPWALPDVMDTGLHATAANSHGGITFPNGCHVCEVEIDPQTGCVELLDYHVGEDVGTVVNPLLLKGQIVGGVVQGIGQALMEQIVYSADNGQLITGSFMDYAMPRAADLCDIQSFSRPVPTKANPLGVKGAGEAGAVGALPAVMNAVGNALWAAGVRHIDMPATPARVWAALQQAWAEVQ